jgi:hypothetical protein
MSNADNPDLASQLLIGLLDCVCTALNASTSLCKCPCRKFINVGETVWDQCCPDGQLWASIERIFTYKTFPIAASNPEGCQTPLAADVVIGLIRCAPTMGNNGEAPTPDELTNAAIEFYADAQTVYQGLICCLIPTRKCQEFAMGQQRFIGPRGGCVGVETRLTIQLTDPCFPRNLS